MHPIGFFVVVWKDFDTDGADGAIYARTYAPDGNPMTPPFKVNETGSDGGSLDTPDVAIDQDSGNIVVVWQQVQAGSGTNVIRERHFGLGGNPLSGEIAVASVTPPDGFVDQPAVTARGSSYTVTWTKNVGFFNELYAQRFDLNDPPVQWSVLVGTSEGFGYNIRSPQIVSDAAGTVTVGFNLGGQVRYKSYNSAGTVIGSDVNIAGFGDHDSDVGLASSGTVDGPFVISWTFTATQPANRDVRAQVYGATSFYTPLGTTIRANSHPVGDQYAPAAAMRPSGEFTLAWVSAGQDPDNCPPEGGPQCAGGTGIYAQQFRLGPADSQTNVGVSIDDNVDPAAVGSQVSYTVTVTNVDASAAVCPVANVTLPEGTTFASVHGGSWNCGGGSSVYCDLVGPLPGGASQSFIVNALMPNASTTVQVLASTNLVGQTDHTTDDNLDAEITTVNDPVPNPFTFTDQTNRASNTEYASNAVTIGGIDTASPVSITGGRYSKNGGAYTTAAGTVVNGDTLRVRLRSALGPNATTGATLTVGGISDTFEITTGGEDGDPNDFLFTDQVNVAPGTVRSSNSITVSGINVPVSISITGGTYRINGTGSFTSAPGTISNGDTVRVRHTSSFSALTTVDTVLTIGGVTDTFSSTTDDSDIVPDAFGFGPTLTNQEPSTLVSSSTIVPTGYDSFAPVKALAGTEYSINGNPFTAAPGTISPGDSLQVRHTTASTLNTVRKTGIRIGNVTGYFLTRTYATPPDD